MTTLVALVDADVTAGKKVLTPDGFGEKLISAFTSPFTDADYVSVSATQFTAAAYFCLGGWLGAIFGRSRADNRVKKNMFGF